MKPPLPQSFSFFFYIKKIFKNGKYTVEICTYSKICAYSFECMIHLLGIFIFTYNKPGWNFLSHNTGNDTAS